MLIGAGMALSAGLLVWRAFFRSGRNGSTRDARWGVAWLALSALVYFAVGALGYDRLAFVPAFAVLGLLPALTFRSTAARVAWAVIAGLTAWWSVSLAAAPMRAGGDKFAGLTLIVGLAALAALQFTFAVVGLLRAAFRR